VTRESQNKISKFPVSLSAALVTNAKVLKMKSKRYHIKRFCSKCIIA